MEVSPELKQSCFVHAGPQSLVAALKPKQLSQLRVVVTHLAVNLDRSV